MGFGRDRDEVNGFLPMVDDFLVANSGDSSGDTYQCDAPPSSPWVRGSRWRSGPATWPGGSASSRSVISQLEQDILAESRGLVRRNVPDSHKIWVRAHKWKPDRQLPCLICKEYGHHPSNCLEGLRDRVAVSHQECVKGYHFPYLHGVWRCQNCGEHLYDSDVKRQFPAFHAREAEKEWNKMKKYGSPCLSWQ